MSELIVDASIAVKWVIEEEGTLEALEVRTRGQLRAPDLIVPECATILWKKARRGEISQEEAPLAAKLLQEGDIEIAPTRLLLEAATQLAIELDHPAYDCLYLALAIRLGCVFVTADERFVRKLDGAGRTELRRRVMGLREAAGSPGPTRRESRRRARPS